jgi:hypothetical protein
LAVVAALVTGAIQVESSALLYVGAACLMLGLWYAANDRRVGAWVHDHLYGEPVFIAIAMVAVTVLLFWADSIPALQRRFGEGWTFTAGVNLASLYFSGMLISWKLRDRWAGEVLMRTQWNKANAAMVVAAAVNVTNLLARQVGKVGNLYVVIPTFAVFLVLAVAYALVVAARVEIRGRGVLNHGGLISWLEIQGASWENREGMPVILSPQLLDDTLYLRLIVRRRMALLRPYIRVPIPYEDVERVDAFVKEHLAVWPA